MTYVIALKLHDLNAVISDTRITALNTGRGWDTSVKNHILFEGCIVGRLGNVINSSEFIYQARRQIDLIEGSPNEKWGKFLHLVDKASPQKGDGAFQLVLSTVMDDRSSFWFYDSGTKSLTSINLKPEDIALKTFGSGRGTELDDLLEKSIDLLSRRLIGSIKAAEKEGLPFTDHPLEIIPYQICFQLSQLTLSFEKAYLNQHFVGGPFSFVAQTTREPFFQRKSIYLLSSLDRANKSINFWTYRLIRIREALFIEKSSPIDFEAPSDISPGEPRTVLLDSSFYSRDEWDDFGIKALKEKEMQVWNSEPFYYFIGMGNTNPSDRVSYAFHINQNGKREDIFDKDGYLTEQIQKDIKATYKKVQEDKDSS